MAITPILYPSPRPDDFSNSNLIAIASIRVVFHFIAFILLLVPARMLWRNHEFGGAVFTILTLTVNLYLFISFFPWYSDDYDNWWTGEYYCDFMSYTFGGIMIECIESLSLVVVMRHLAITIGDLRASPMTVKEKRNRNLIQALIIVPYTLACIPLTWITSQARYAILPFTGCIFVPDNSWVGLVFLSLLPCSFILAGVFYSSKISQTHSSFFDMLYSNMNP